MVIDSSYHRDLLCLCYHARFGRLSRLCSDKQSSVRFADVRRITTCDVTRDNTNIIDRDDNWNLLLYKEAYHIKRLTQWLKSQ